jgi:alpha-mannosidase
MKFDQLAVLLPCRSLEDLTLKRPADEAEQLLSAWSALWHPALLAAAHTTPQWFSAEEPPQNPAGHLIILPPCCQPLLPGDWLDQAEAAGASVVSNLQRRDPMVAAALGRLAPPPPLVDAELAADFLALAFCFFVVELLTRQLRYMSNLDETSFRAEALAAAEEAVKGDLPAAHERLQSAFRLLGEAREYFYPVEAHLIDLTLVAPTTLGAALREELAGKLPRNLLLSGEAIAEMAQREPATLAALKQALENRTAAIVGGEFNEGALPLLPPEAIRSRLRRGLAAYQRHLGTRPTVFGRRRFGLTPVLPQILQSLGFVAVLHFTLDDGRFPTGNQSCIQWEGLDGTTIQAVGRLPFDISRADAVLSLPEKLGNWLDLDHVATVVLAHWPGQSSPWYEDLRRIAAYWSVIGTFTTVTDYFEQTGTSGQRTEYKADDYRSPYLRQAVAAGEVDPISRWVRYYRRRAAVEAAQTLDTLAAAVRGTAQGAEEVLPSLAEELLLGVENALAAAHDSDTTLDQRVQSSLDEALGRFCRSLGTAPHPDAERKGYLLANPWSFSQRLGVEMRDLSTLPDVAGAVRAAGEVGGKKAAVVDLPALGFAWIGPGAGNAPPPPPAEQKGWSLPRKPKGPPPLAAENTLRNEFFAVELDPTTGALRSISDYRSRGPRLAQQIALRLPRPEQEADPGHDSHYSIMVADEMRVTSSGPLLGEIVCRGRLVDRQAERLAGFRQATRVWRGSRLIELKIELDVARLPEPNPWNSYYAARFAWSDPEAELYRSVSLANRRTEAVQLEAPHFVEIRVDKLRTVLLTGGLPYHRRCGPRKLDTLLVVRGETARRFRMAIAIDPPSPMAAALGFLAPQTMLAAPAPPLPSGWLFHLDARNVVATHWEPIEEAGRVAGFRVRLLETEGRRARLGLRGPRAIRSACKIKYAEAPPDESPPDDLPVEGDCVTIEMGPHAWVEVEARFRGRD